MIELLLDHLTDPFRIGLLIALLATTARNLAVTGRVVPLLAGAVFVAVLIPMTLGGGVTPQAVAVGLAANAVILAVLLALWALVRRLRG